MANIEKVIKGLECCMYKGCGGCPYFKGNLSCQDDKDKDALGLLKDQAKQIETLEKINAIDLNPKWPYVFNNYRKVVLCKDCRHGILRKTAIGATVIRCEYLMADVNADWFCADGERQNDG